MTNKKLFVLALITAILLALQYFPDTAPAQTLKVTIRDSQTQNLILTGDFKALSYDKATGVVIIISNQSTPPPRGYIDGVPFDIYKIEILTKPK